MGEGILLIVTGPPGGGKDAVTAGLMKKYGWDKVVTNTTRPQRPGEVNGVDYHFVTKEEFLAWQKAGEMVETNNSQWAENLGTLYGTSKRELEKVLLGRNLIWRIDPMATLKVSQRIRAGFSLNPEGAEKILQRTVKVYVTPKDWSEIPERITKRDGGEITKQLERLKEERADFEEHRKEFEKIIVYNERGMLDQTIEEVQARANRVVR